MSFVSFDRDPDQYRHWKVAIDGPLATLSMDVDEDGGLVDGYQLKLNSYDLGVDIELHDIIQRLRFEHPTVKAVVLTSAKERMFCAGANIYMLSTSSHAWKVNFCKFTNETRNGLEDSSAHSGLKFLAAINGTCAGGGYEIALACDEIVMIDDRSSTVSLPEVPLLGVLPGTGGLTRVVDKRGVRRDLADLFCTNADGVKAERAKEWGLVDAIAPPSRFEEIVQVHAEGLADRSDRPDHAQGVTLTPLKRRMDEMSIAYEHVAVAIDRSGRTATVTVEAPDGDQPSSIEAIRQAGAEWWPLAMARQLDDALLHLRHNFADVGTMVLKTRGEIDAVMAVDAVLETHQADWFVREVIGMLRRTLARLEVTSRSLYAIIDEGSCFAGTLAELAFAADRSYMLDLPDAEEEGQDAPMIVLSPMNFGPYLMVNHLTRLQTRFGKDHAVMEGLRERIGERLDAPAALAAGLITVAPDDLDWDDEIRLALEERAGLSPDALTGMEASLRFAGTETMETKIFGRLSAWQNWVFNRPNAVGEQGALRLFGSGSKAHFDWERV
ncbi:MAG: 2,3-epoxybenzoyl-CoA dihydrolase [Pseudomonadota bacterium]